MAVSVSVPDVLAKCEGPALPLLLDVRRAHVFAAAPSLIARAEWRDPFMVDAWAGDLPDDREIVVYCVHGLAVSQGVADALAAAGRAARYLEGGIDAWLRSGGAVERKAIRGVTWITRERPKIDRVACPWLIGRFIDTAPRFVFVPSAVVLDEAERLQAIAFDVSGADLSHRVELCSFDVFLADYGLDDPALQHLATIVRGADTGRLDLAPESAGLLAISLGMSANVQDDHAMLGHCLVIYDALYAWCRSRADESHGWPPAADAGRV